MQGILFLPRRTEAKYVMRRQLFATSIAVALAMVVSFPEVGASTGSLDSSFGTGGKVKTDFGFGVGERATGVAIQSDGRIVAAGPVRNADLSVVVGIARYNANGAADSSFGSAGLVRSNLPIGDRTVDVAIQSDGRLVIAGFADNGFLVARFNASGSIDNTFGNGGSVITSFGGVFDGARALALQADGKIVVAGFHGDVDTEPVDFALVRYNSDGSLDPTFGSGGKVTTDFGTLDDEAYAIAIQPDGKIVAAGISNCDFAFARYNQNGSLDLSFGNNGKAVVDFFGACDFALGVALQPDGRIIASGRAAVNGSITQLAALVRLNSNGTLDTSFGSGGKVATAVNSNDVQFFADVAVQANGRIVACGGADMNAARGMMNLAAVVARYNADGSLDASFGTGGSFVTSFGTQAQQDSFNTVAIQSDGNIIAAGEGGDFSNDDFVLTRIIGDPDGGAAADVSVSQTDSPDPIVTGTNLTYTITVSNAGPVAATDVVVSDTLPANTSFVSCSATGAGVCGGSGNSRSVSFASIAPNTSETVTLVATVSCSVANATSISNTVSASTTVFDPNPANNSSTITTLASNPSPSITCPGNLTAIADNGGTAVVTYADPLVSDNCSGANFSCSPPSGSTLPVGATAVTCVATDSGGATASCSFVISVVQALLDNCIQDDVTGDVLRFSSRTGDYEFTSCRTRELLAGRCVISIGPCKIELRSTPIAGKSDRAIYARLDSCTRAGTATITIPFPGITYSLIDSNTTNNRCACH
jgi:uncharacterized delta-60 repeat protein/uncharacterized repeat protein (TIGR01451 family)